MKTHLRQLILLAIILLANVSDADESLNGVGATFPFPIYSAWAFKYRNETGVLNNYQGIGSGGGIQQIAARTVDFGATDEPQSNDKLKELGLFQFPAVIGGVTIVINVPGIEDGELKFDSDTLCGVFLGEIKSWSDRRLKALNPLLHLPDTNTEVVYRSDGSGTTAIFTHYLAEVCPAFKEKIGEGKLVRFPSGIGGKGNGGVANLVKRESGSIGYVELAYAKQNELTLAQLKNAAGNYVMPNIASLRAAASSGAFDFEKSSSTWLTNSKAESAWPITGATFVLLAKEKIATDKRVVKFFEWAFQNGDSQAESLFYAPLPIEVKTSVRQFWKKNGIF